jgi:hypothetical protein
MPVHLDTSGIVGLDVVHEFKLDGHRGTEFRHTTVNQVRTPEFVLPALTLGEVDESNGDRTVIA